MADRCEGCKCTCAEFVVTLFNELLLRDYLVRHGVLSNATRCPRCLNVVNANWDNSAFRCQRLCTVNRRKARCDFFLSVYHNTFFRKSKLAPAVIAQFVLHWLTRGPPRHEFFQRELGISNGTVVDWSSYFREVCVAWAVGRNRRLGGDNVVVEIYEAKIGKRKYNVRRLVEGQWVFGGVERDNPQNIFVVAVPDRKAATLINVLQEHVLPKTTVVSDCWRAHRRLGQEGYRHLTENHSLNFVDPLTGANTLHIERAWREVRANVPSFGRWRKHYSGYLAEFMFKRAYPDHTLRLHHFWTAAATLYPPMTL